MPCRVLRFEFESARQLRVTSALVLLALLVGVAGFVILLIVSRSSVVCLHSGALINGTSFKALSCRKMFCDGYRLVMQSRVFLSHDAFQQ